MSGVSSTMLTAEQLAARWHVNVKTIYAAIEAGQLPALRLGRTIRISIAVVERMESQGCVVPTGGSDVGPTR